MNETKFETKWILPEGTGAMSVVVSGDTGGDQPRVEVALRSHLSGVELTIPACERLRDFMAGYMRENVPRGLIPGGGILPWEGLYVDVLPEHAEEIAARIAVFVTDPANHAVRSSVRATVVVGPDLVFSPCYKWTEKQARRAVQLARRTVEAMFPE